MILAKSVTKTYGDQVAVDELDLDIPKGQFFGLLGPNGSGKTTSIHMLSTLINPTRGSITIDGTDIRKSPQQVRQHLGLVFQESALDRTLSVEENLYFCAGLHGLRKASIDGRVNEMLALFELEKKRKSPVGILSGGMRRAVDIIRGVLHSPKVLFLDEPTAGVDVDMRKETWKVIRDLKQQGVTIVLTTHYIEEAEEIADRIAIIDSGNILLVEGKDKLMRRLGTKKIFIELEEAISELPTNLNAFDIKIESGGRNLIYAYDSELDKAGVTSVLRNILTSGISIKDIRTYQSSLEDIFVKLIQKGKGS